MTGTPTSEALESPVQLLEREEEPVTPPRRWQVLVMASHPSFCSGKVRGTLTEVFNKNMLECDRTIQRLRHGRSLVKTGLTSDLALSLANKATDVLGEKVKNCNCRTSDVIVWIATPEDL
jgi:hypothetical protein